jgi:uncharacterized protein
MALPRASATRRSGFAGYEPANAKSEEGAGMLKTMMRRVLGAFGLATAATCALAPQAAQAKGAPALWSVTDADTTVYLFGTIHLLPEKYDWRTPRFEQAVAGSQELVVETIIDEKNPMQLLGVLTQMGFSNKVPPIAQRVPAEKRAALEDAIKKSGIPRPAFDQMETWTAAFMLLGIQFKELGLKSDQGVEITLRNSFTSQGKAIGQLETNAEQLGFFDALPEKAQQALLEGAIEKPEDVTKQFQGMLQAWSRGDVAAIAQSFNRDLSETPELKDALIKRRNANWSRWIEQRMARPGALMIAVGAGHLAGSDSVIEMLKKDGYRVRRVQ